MTRLALLALATALTGCAATPQARIDDNPAAFAALPPEQQDKVKAGAVAVGFDTRAVELSLGKPDRIVERETAEGATEVWVYYRALPSVYGGGYCAPGYSRYGTAFYCSPILTGPTQYEERTRVAFKDGKVVSVERAR